MEPASAYRSLLKELGPQGWWPVTTEEKPEYHPGDYSYPRSEQQQWEICVGAVLTQNTSWKNVEKALGNLRSTGVTDINSFLKIKKEKLAKLIRSSGYYNQKAVKLKEFARTIQSSGGVGEFLKKVTRDQLLEVKGIGPETADSILLYAGKRPFFVVDAYTRRLFGFPKEMSYEEIRSLFESRLPRDRKIYNEFHALIVQKGKSVPKGIIKPPAPKV